METVRLLSVLCFYYAGCYCIKKCIDWLVLDLLLS